MLTFAQNIKIIFFDDLTPPIRHIKTKNTAVFHLSKRKAAVCFCFPRSLHAVKSHRINYKEFHAKNFM